MSIYVNSEKELKSFRSKYKIRDPEKCPKRYEDRPITTREGLRELKPAPAKNVSFGFPTSCPKNLGCQTYIWVIDDDGLLIVRERSLKSLKTHLLTIAICL